MIVYRKTVDGISHCTTRITNPLPMAAISLRRRIGTSGLIWVCESLRLIGCDCELGHLQRDAKRQWIIAGT